MKRKRKKGPKLGKFKRFVAWRVIKPVIKRALGDEGMDKLKEMLSGKKTIIASVLGVVATILGAMGQPEVAEQVREGAEVVKGGDLWETLRWLSLFLVAIFMRLGILKK